MKNSDQTQNQEQCDIACLVFEKFLQAWRDLDVNLLLQLLSDQFTLHKRHQPIISDLERAKAELTNWFLKIINTGYGVTVKEFGNVSSHYEKMVSVTLNDKFQMGILSLAVLFDETSIYSIIDYDGYIDVYPPLNK